MKFLGRHVLVEFHQCSPELLDDVAQVRDILLEGARLSGATILQETFHEFSPQGVSGVIVIAESHVAVHTWPEHGYAGIDIFTCGDTVDPWTMQKYFQERFEPGQVFSMELKRGLLTASYLEMTSAWAPAPSVSQACRVA